VAAPLTTDLQITGSVKSNGAVFSDAVYTWQIRNNGKGTPGGVVFTTTLPPAMLFKAVTPSAGTCSTPAVGAQGAVTCTVDQMSTALTISVTGTPVVVGSYTVSGNVTFNGTDTPPSWSRSPARVMMVS
jgi:uncharacterized repeat protein (TIGR01451 family)